MQRLSQPLKAQNVDGSANQGGIIHHKVTLYLQIAETKEKKGIPSCQLWSGESNPGAILASRN